MDMTFYIYLTGLDAGLKKSIKKFLSVDKPLFVEDVAEPWQRLYLAMEYIEEPSLILGPSPDALLIGWPAELDRGELQELAGPFLTAELTVAGMLLVPEGGDDSIWIRSLEEQDWLSEGALMTARGDFSTDKRVAKFMMGTQSLTLQRPPASNWAPETR